MQRAEYLAFVHTLVFVFYINKILHTNMVPIIYEMLIAFMLEMIVLIHYIRLILEDLSLKIFLLMSLYKLEAITYVATENDVEDDAINILTCRYECYI